MTRVFAGNVKFDVTEADLQAAFAAYGPVSSARLVTEKSNGASRGFGFVEMAWQTHAVAAIAALDGAVLKGRSITVSLAHARSDGGSRGNPPRGWAVVGEGRNRW
jgi:RNA recognition motif-containing protein